jgi:DNA-damage-inducible protein J
VKGVDIMANTTNFSVRMDSDIKKQCESLYNELGMNLTTAINVFLRQSLRVGGFPFDVKLEQPNRETIAAMLEAERITHDPNVKRYSDVEEALRELKR